MNLSFEYTYLTLSEIQKNLYNFMDFSIIEISFFVFFILFIFFLNLFLWPYFLYKLNFMNIKRDKDKKKIYLKRIILQKQIETEIEQEIEQESLEKMKMQNII